MLGRVRNLREFAGVLAFDKWTGNADGRQVVFHKEMRERKYTAVVHRFWLLLQCRRVGFSRCSAAGSVRAQ